MARNQVAQARESNMGRAGFPLWLRARILSHPGFMDGLVPAAQIAADFGRAVSERTIRRYRQRYSQQDTVGRRAANFGFTPNVHDDSENLLRLILKWRSDLFLDELVSLLNAVYAPGRTFTTRQVFDALKRMQFVRLRKEWRNVSARFQEQWSWFHTLPEGLPRARGIAGVPTAAMVDMDETVVRIGGLRRTMARAPIGTRAICRDITDYTGTAYTVILATDINVGVVAYQIMPCTVNRERYLWFLQFVLFPHLGTVPRFLLMDNASSHHGQVVYDACEERGHVILYRPAYSPHLAWIEQQFSILKGELRRRHASLTDENIVSEIESTIRDCITVEKVRAAAAHCHYRVPGYPYQPWIGD